jgi:hypothetical protein
MTPWERFKSWLIFFPCLSLTINVVGVPIGVWAAYEYFTRADILPVWTVWLAIINLVLLVIELTLLYVNTWKRTGLVCTRWADRVWYMIRINPISAMIWWFLWIIPLCIGFGMYVRDGGLAWQRTEKIDANKLLIRRKFRRGEDSPDTAEESRVE